MKKLLVRIILPLLLIGALIGGVYTLLPRPHLLLEHAVKIADIDQNGKEDIWFNYYWLTPEKLLYFRAPERYARSWFLYDVPTKVTTPLPELSKHIQGSWVRHGDLQPSPDGKWILWQDEGGPIVASTLDGSRCHQWPGGMFQEEFAWMPDSRHWLGFHRTVRFKENSAVRAFLHDVDRPEESKEIPVNLSQYRRATLFDYLAPTIKADTIRLQRLPVGEMSEAAENVYDEFTLAPDIHFVRQVREPILIPKELRENSKLSPQGDRFCQIKSEVYVHPFLNWLHRFVPSVKVVPQEIATLLIHTPASKTVTEGGYLVIRPEDKDKYGRDAPVDIEWRPDGKQITFCFQGALWMVPVPSPP